MEDKKIVTYSKLLSKILRHAPEIINLQLESDGFVEISILLNQLEKFNKPIDFELLKLIVATNNKKRFEFNADLTKIRAVQGHSIDVDLNYEPVQPPEILYHGTAVKNIESIKLKGITKQSRQYVHLSHDHETAVNVGKRHGKPIVLKIRAKEMWNNGTIFYHTSNNVWLTEKVDVQYIIF